MTDLSKLSNAQKARLGEQYLVSYQNEMVKRFGDDYNITFDSLKRIVLEREDDFLTNLGDAAAVASLGQRRMAEAMERVAEKSTKDSIPKVYTFITGITDELSDFDFSLFSDVAIDIAKDIQQKGQEVSESIGEAATGIVDSVGFLGRNLKMIVIGIVAIGGFILYSRTKSLSKE